MSHKSTPPDPPLMMMFKSFTLSLPSFTCSCSLELMERTQGKTSREKDRYTTRISAGPQQIANKGSDSSIQSLHKTQGPINTMNFPSHSTPQYKKEQAPQLKPNLVSVTQSPQLKHPCQTSDADIGAELVRHGKLLSQIEETNSKRNTVLEGIADMALSNRTTMWLEILVALVVVGMTLRFWYTYTSGHCTSTRSMAGKTVIITGGTAGIGKETARDLLRRGARVIIACRNMEKGRKVADELRSASNAGGEVLVRRLDTSDLSSVRTFAKEVLDTEKAIHVLINNAGIYGMGKRQVTADGLELTMATNHFGHFLLTNLLLGRLKESGPSRIINVSSLGHIFAPKFDLNDLAINNDYNPNNAYTTSKLCNLLFTRELADKMAGTGVTVNSLHPGIVRTEIFDSMNLSFGTFLTHILLAVASKDAVSGAQTSIHLAVSEEVEGMTGRYFGDCKEVSTSDVALRKDLATGLWEASVKAVGLKKDEIHY
ncbi:hypothetical protein O3P69_000612 [Scylla paramamosain]|uniref:Retinol dehydrogenase 11 n=1 Tax=Scylla paramamosain TaxID=85552 RepID=A0AAW0UQJ9_SCYPA